MSAPTSTCCFIFSNSASVSFPGLLRMCSGTASLPVSCSSAAASTAFSDASSATPSARARPTAYACTRRTWLCVQSSFASIAIASVSTVDRYSRSMSPRCRLASSRRPNVARSVRWKTASSGSTIAAAATLRCCTSRIRQNATDAAPRYPSHSQRKFFFQTSTGGCRQSSAIATAVSPEFMTK